MAEPQMAPWLTRDHWAMAISKAQPSTQRPWLFLRPWRWGFAKAKGIANMASSPFQLDPHLHIYHIQRSVSVCSGAATTMQSPWVSVQHLDFAKKSSWRPSAAPKK